MSAVTELIIEKKAAFTLAGLNLRCKPGSKEMPRLWGRYDQVASTMPGVIDPAVCYGVCHNFDLPDR